MKFTRILFLLSAMAASQACIAQVAITGSITGTVTDSAGAVVPGASVSVQSPEMMTPKTLKAAQDGGFTFTQLPPGRYEVKVSAPNFKDYERSNILLTAGFTATLNIPLAIGNASETVNVSAAAPLLNLKSTQIGTTFDLHMLQNLPTGRDPWSTIEQAPGVTTDQFDVGGSKSYYQSTMSVHGSIPGQMAYSLNGLKLNWPGGGGGATAFYSDPDSFQELQIITDSAPAEVSVGGVYINMVSKSGSNQLHGTANVYYDTNALQSQIQEPTYNGVPVHAGNGPIVMIRDLTANAGGPILKDRWWIYGGWRYLITSEQLLSIPRPDGSIPISVNHQTNTTMQNDIQIGMRNHLGVTWWYNEQNQYSRRNTAATGIQFTSDAAAWRQIEPAYVVQGDLTTQITPNLVLDSRAGYLHLTFPLRYEPQVTPTDIAVEDISLSTLTGAATENLVEPAAEWRLNQSAQYAHSGWWGSHEFRAGWDYAYNFSGLYANVNQDIVALFNNGNAYEVYQYDGPTRERTIFFEGSLFGQDAWTISRRLTLDLGLRFDHFHEYEPTQTNPPAAFFASYFPNRSITHEEVALWKDVSPRVGASWDVRGNGKSVLRASFGRYDLTEGTSLGESINPNVLSGYVYTWKDLNGDGYPQQNEWLTTPSGAPATPVGALGAVHVTIDPHLSRPYSYEVVGGYQQQVLRDVVVSANYYYRTTKDQIAQYNNAAPITAYEPVTTFPSGPNAGKPITNVYTGQPLTMYNLPSAYVGKFAFYTTNIAATNNNQYNAVEFTAQKRFSRGLELLTGFTVQSMTGTYIAGVSDNFSDPNLNINRANSNLDQDATYVFKISGQYQEPRTKLSVSFNYEHYTGYPIRPTNAYTGFTQGAETVALEPSTLREPNVDIANIRFARPTTFHQHYILEPVLDLFNITNSNSIVTKVATYGGNFLKPVDLINPRIARFGLKFTF